MFFSIILSKGNSKDLFHFKDTYKCCIYSNDN